MSPEVDGKLFSDGEDAGRRLAEAFRARLRPEAVVLGLPRGGMVVASAMAQSLGLPADVYVVRKLRAPLIQEFAVGAAAEDGPVYIDRAIGGIAGDFRRLHRGGRSAQIGPKIPPAGKVVSRRPAPDAYHWTPSRHR